MLLATLAVRKIIREKQAQKIDTTDLHGYAWHGVALNQVSAYRMEYCFPDFGSSTNFHI